MEAEQETTTRGTADQADVTARNIIDGVNEALATRMAPTVGATAHFGMGAVTKTADSLRTIFANERRLALASVGGHIERLEEELSVARAIVAGGDAFQPRVRDWMQACFGTEVADETVERNHRFLEEALELVQALGCTASEAHQLVNYVFGRPVGEVSQELGGVMVTAAALASAAGYDMAGCGEKELARVWTCIEKIRAKQAAKPKHSPLPGAPLP